MNDLKELMHTLTLYAKTEDKNFLKCVALASAEMEGGPEEIGTKQTDTWVSLPAGAVVQRGHGHE